METWDSGTLSNVKKIPLLTVRRHYDWLATFEVLTSLRPTGSRGSA